MNMLTSPVRPDAARPVRALLIDAYDSFIYIIRQYLLEAGVDVTVMRNDRVRPADVERDRPDFVVLGPGPGHPGDCGYVEMIRALGGMVPILGVCLGHQAIGLAFGGTIARADVIMHGKTSTILHDGHGCFRDRTAAFEATRYHSLVVADAGLPVCLEVSARSADDGHIMGLRHRTLPIEGVQFHPESIRTVDGAALFRNFMKAYGVAPSGTARVRRERSGAAAPAAVPAQGG